MKKIDMAQLYSHLFWWYCWVIQKMITHYQNPTNEIIPEGLMLLAEMDLQAKNCHDNSPNHILEKAIEIPETLRVKNIKDTPDDTKIIKLRLNTYSMILSELNKKMREIKKPSEQLINCRIYFKNKYNGENKLYLGIKKEKDKKELSEEEKARLINVGTNMYPID